MALSLSTLRRRLPGTGRRRVLSRDDLLRQQNKLTKRERFWTIFRGVVLSQFAVPIGSFLYFLWFQMRYQWSYQNKDGSTSSFIDIWLKDAWDRLPVHVDNLLHAGLFAPLGTTTEPAWWVDARHDFRKVLIGFVVTLLVGSLTVGFKKRKRASGKHMAVRVPLALMAAATTAGLLIWAFIELPHSVSTLGALNSVPYVRDYIGDGQLELLVIGIVSGLVAKRILARTFDTLQLISIERNVAQGDDIHDKWWKRVLYGANYSRRFDYIKKRVDEESYTVDLGHPWIGYLLVALTPFMLFLLGGGIWLLYFGPARGAAH